MGSQKDVDLIREYNQYDETQTNGVYFAENLTVPVRMTLLSPDDDFSSRPIDDDFDSTNEFECIRNKCFYCCVLNKEGGEMKIESEEVTKRRDLALDLIAKFLFMINVDKTKLKKLISLRKYHPGVFNFCFFNLVFTRFLSSYRLKFHVRKCVQELFSDVFRIYQQQQHQSTLQT